MDKGKDTGRDRLRELLDAVLDEDNTTLAEMAGDAFVSPFHFSRQLRRGTGESPVAMRRRVMLERAAHRRQLARTLVRLAGHDVDEGDPILYLRRRNEP